MMLSYLNVADLFFEKYGYGMPDTFRIFDLF